MKKLIVPLALGVILSTAVAARSNANIAPKPDLTRQQAVERADALFRTFDMNHDGIISRDEANQVGVRLLELRITSGKDPAPGIGGHTRRFLEHAFAGAQSVTRDQFRRAMLAHFDQMDVNHDGILTAAEREQARQGQSEARQDPGN